MSRPAPEIRLSTEEKEILLRWMRSSKTELRLVERARVILLASSGLSGKEIALKMKTREARVSKWLRRFAQDRMAGLSDSVRSGEKRRKYTSLTEGRILKALDEPAPCILPSQEIFPLLSPPERAELLKRRLGRGRWETAAP